MATAMIINMIIITTGIIITVISRLLFDQQPQQLNTMDQNSFHHLGQLNIPLPHLMYLFHQLTMTPMDTGPHTSLLMDSPFLMLTNLVAGSNYN
jgi:hypothetical protein